MNNEAFDENKIAKDQTIDDQNKCTKNLLTPEIWRLLFYTYKAHSLKWCLIKEGETVHK